jgi:hypothetical protein
MESGGRGIPLPPSVYRFFAAISRFGASCIPRQTAAIRAEETEKCHIFGKSAAMCHNFFFFCQTLLTKRDRCAIVRIKEDDAVALTASQTIIANPPKGGDAKL